MKQTNFIAVAVCTMAAQAVYVRCKYVRLNASRKALSTGGR
jgi:hypothetical protein